MLPHRWMALFRLNSYECTYIIVSKTELSVFAHDAHSRVESV